MAQAAYELAVKVSVATRLRRCRMSQAPPANDYDGHT
jgi:hypothetical protein